ncbi:Putative folylpolyglutamate synthetase, mur-like, catalytic domain superfamily [Colletotrichum destructivum]|uniref:tetrahydrofolate synthase n=1 Tax=Colletotrichum destructivum TaxID=34406 RepID=A0AAX4IV68_9PEZI|nr:Putative folylpolyglutamate synthetase, mur-like, catalytic domain superfamily [Colletotrichum destructivum]
MRPLLLRHTSATSLSIKHALLFFRPVLSPCRLIATMSSSNSSSSSPSSSRTYADALALLNTLIPNLKIHALFGSKPKDPEPQDATTTPKPPPADPNLLAIPEMRAWLLRAGLTPDRLSTLSYIHVAGTKGKGSVAALTTSALLSSPSRSVAGRVGTYTSPHLVTPRERIAIDGRPVDQALFAAAFFELWDALSAAPADDALAIPAGSKPFYFRFLTLLALHLFLREGVRSVVLECGIGGEYDATNAVVLPPASSSSSVFSPVTAAVITQLGVDHVAMLGDTPEAIAWHKAGVMKPGVAAFTRRLDAQPAVMAVLRARAREIGAELVEVPDDDVLAWSGVPGAKLPGGDFQRRNQALAALAATRHLQVLEARGVDAGVGPGAKTATVPPLPPPRLRDVSETIVDGLREATLRGRHEVIERAGVSWHLDGAHNADSLAEVARWMAPVVAERRPDADFVLVFNQQERDASALLLGLLREMEAAGVDVGSRLRSAVFTRNDRASDAEKADVAVQEKCAAAFREAYPAVEAFVCRDLVEMKNAIDALAAATTTEAQSIRVLVTGSMYLVGNVIGLLEPEGLL